MLHIDHSEFADIIAELTARPLQVNEYRNKAGSGRSQTFGVVGRRCLPPDASRMNWLRPKLYHHLLEFAEKYVAIPFNSITVNQNYRADKHRDKNNKGVSLLVGFGSYKGGDLVIHEGDLSGNHSIWCNPIIADFSKVYHSVEPFEGDRYSLVFYQYETSRSVPLPPFSVKKEGEKFFFYRGDEKILRTTGLPHPLRKKNKPMIVKEEKEVTVTFE